MTKVRKSKLGLAIMLASMSAMSQGLGLPDSIENPDMYEGLDSYKKKSKDPTTDTSKDKLSKAELKRIKRQEKLSKTLME